MSRENVEAFRRAIEAFNARSADGMMAELDPGAEFKPVLAGVTDTPYRGEEGVRNFLAATDESFEQFELHCERIEDHGDFVLAVNEAHARGKASGAEIRRPIVQIAEFQDGKCVWLQSFQTPAEALEAVGLRE
jgi:ketosteroid isomerase-like protein